LTCGDMYFACFQQLFDANLDAVLVLQRFMIYTFTPGATQVV